MASAGVMGVDRLVPDHRMGVGGQGVLPLGGVPGVAPGGAAQLDHPGRGLGEGGDGRGTPEACLPRLPFLGDRVPALSNGGAIVVGDVTGPGKADRGIGPQPYVPAPSMDYNSLDPRFAPGRGDVEV